MIELRLLGGLDLVGPDPSASVRARRRHPMMLLALVAAAAPRPVGRERIMAFLWPESDSDRASNSLRQALHCLRRELSEDLFLPETPSGIQLDGNHISVDLWTFRDASARKAYGDAVAAYRGPFLDGFQIPGAPEFSRWMEVERDRAEREYGSALDALARQAEDAGRHDDAVAWRRRQAAADPFSSRVALSLLRALVAAGDRTSALEYSAVHESLVRAHLDADPDPAIEEFVTSIRDTPPRGHRARLDQRSASVEVGAATPAAATAADPTPADSSASATHTSNPSDAAGTLKRLTDKRGRRLLAVGAVALAVVGAVGAAMLGAFDDTVIVLATGASAVNGRDMANRLVACEGPMCPEQSLPQDAYIVPTHVFHTDPPRGTRFISPAATGTTLPPPGYPCCSTAVFENEFTLPDDAVSATISITLIADNQAIVAINGVEFGRHVDSLDSSNHGGPPTTFARTFSPAPYGVNRLRVTLWDGGGAAAVNYQAMVTHHKKPKPDRRR